MFIMTFAFLAIISVVAAMIMATISSVSIATKKPQDF
jgi:hypothetical protein